MMINTFASIIVSGVRTTYGLAEGSRRRGGVLAGAIACSLLVTGCANTGAAPTSRNDRGFYVGGGGGPNF